MAALTVQSIVDAGTAPTFVPASASDTVSDTGNGNNVFVVYKNTSATDAVTVTITPEGNTTYGVALPPKVVNVPLGSECWIPLRRAYVVDGLVTLAVTGAGLADTDVAVVKAG